MSIAENLAKVRAEIGEACRAVGRAETDVTLIAVSKVHPAERLIEAYEAGQRVFGENRVQELQAKAEEVRGLAGAEFHLIGPLQNNKTAKAAELFDTIDTITEVKTAGRLATAAMALGKRLPVLVEVKLSPEESKHGVAPTELPALLAAIAHLDGLEVRGLMTVPPWDEDAETVRPYFRQLRELRDGLAGEYPTLRELSMGMSNDFRVAIEEGSTAVRVGTAIFGARPKPAMNEDGTAVGDHTTVIG